MQTDIGKRAAGVAFPRLRESDGTRLLVESSKLFARCLDKDLILETFKQIVEQTMDCDGLLVSSFNPSTGMIRCTFAWVDGDYVDTSVFPEVAFDPEPGRGMQSEVIRTGEARLFSDVGRRVEEGTGEYYQEKDGEFVELPKGSQPKAQSALMAPLKLDDVVVGVAQVMTDRGAYDAQDLVFFEGLALQMTAALNNAELFEAKQAEIAARIQTEDALREAEKTVLELNSGLERLVADRTVELERTIADLDGFCYSASHDLRAPLRGISGLSAILLEDYSAQLPAEAQAHLISMREAVNKMSRLIEGHLKIARLGRSTMNRSEIDLTSVARRIVGELGADKQTAFEIQSNLRVSADRDMLDIALECLFDNAVKFSSFSAMPRVELGSRLLDGQNVLFIADNGIGFEQRYANKLFLPFEKLQGDGQYAGTGVGLAIVKRIVERHGGRIWAEGNLGVGSTFFFTLG